jgi:hypothetical protein
MFLNSLPLNPEHNPVQLNVWLSLIVTPLLCVSSALFNYSFVLRWTNNTPWQWWGIIATIALCLAMSFALLPLRSKFYELFLVAHIAFVILALVGCWYHLVPHFGYAYGYQVWLYIAFAFWSADRLARLVRIAYYNRLDTSTAIVEALPDCDIMQVSVFPRVAWGFGPGQHTFLYVPGLGKFWESHPFSIASWKKQGQSLSTTATSATISGNTVTDETKDSGVVSEVTKSSSLSAQTQTQDRPCIQFLIRAHSGMTSALHRRLISSPSRSSMEMSIYTEGPYAGHKATLQPLFAADTILCLVGGIGITNALGFVQEYTSRDIQRGESMGDGRSGYMKKAKRFILAWSAREMGLIEHVRENFLAQRNDVAGVEYSFWCTGAISGDSQKLDSINDEGQKPESLTPRATVAVGRMDIGTVMRSSLEAGHQTTVVVCGPGNMADEATKQVVNYVKEGFRVDLVEEAFAW